MNGRRYNRKAYRVALRYWKEGLTPNHIARERKATMHQITATGNWRKKKKYAKRWDLLYHAETQWRRR